MDTGRTPALPPALRRSLIGFLDRARCLAARAVELQSPTVALLQEDVAQAPRRLSHTRPPPPGLLSPLGGGPVAPHGGPPPPQQNLDQLRPNNPHPHICPLLQPPTHTHVPFSQIIFFDPENCASLSTRKVLQASSLSQTCTGKPRGGFSGVIGAHCNHAPIFLPTQSFCNVCIFFRSSAEF